MRRRDFITLLGGAAAVWPLAARAQQTKMPVIGYLYAGTPEGGAVRMAAFRNGLSESGFVEGRNVAVEYRFAGSDGGRQAIDDLLRRRVAVLVVSPAAVAGSIAKAATKTIPIVFYTGIDPVAAGLVTSLNRPGGNVTGISSMNTEIMPKRLSLMSELLPRSARLGMFVNPNDGVEPMVSTMQAGAAKIGRRLEAFSVSSNPEIDMAFASAAQMQLDGLLFSASPLFGNRRAQIVALALYHRLPALYYDRIFVETGGLMSYGSRVEDEYRQLGIYTARVLKGEKPTDLPVLQPTKFEMVISLHTANLMGIEVPTTLLARADEVIE